MSLTDILGKNKGQTLDKRKRSYAENPDHPQKVGKRFEDEIVVANSIYEENGLAHIEKTEVPTLFIPARFDKKAGKNVDGIMIYRKKASVDFIGAFLENGIWKPIFIEAKSTKKGIIEVGQVKTGIKENQIKNLKWLSKHGIPHYIIWEIREVNYVYKFTYEQLELATNKGERKSISIMEAEEFHFSKLIRSQRGNLIYLDYLGLLS